MFTCERDAEALAENFWAEARKILEQNNPSNERIAQAKELLVLCYELRNKPLDWLNQFKTRYLWRTI
jgi:hypothetical protein